MKNAVGYFEDQSGEFVVQNMRPKRPLINYLWNEQTVANCDQFGYGKSVVEDSGSLRIMEQGARLIYLKDNATGKFYSPNRNFTNLPFELFECRVGQGYQTVVSEYDGVRTELTLLVPASGRVISYRITVENLTQEEKDLSLYFVIEPQANLTGDTSYGYADHEQMRGLIYPHVAYDSKNLYEYLYFASEKKFRSFAVSRDAFCGTYGSFANPEGVEDKKLSSRGTTFEDYYLAAVQFPARLKGRGKRAYTFALAAGRNAEECRTVAKANAKAAPFARQLRAQAVAFQKQRGVFRAEMPDKLLQSLTNVWLKRQLSLGKTWGRVYGKGFRDVMQDISAFVSFDCPLARARILKALSKQYNSGNPIRMFEPDYTAPYNDGAAWIPATVLAYLKESGDFAILEEVVPYLDGGEDTVYAHVLRGINYLLHDLGAHGLVLLRRGDWNDSLNGAGNLNRGEGVWLSIATVKACRETIEIAERIGKTEDAATVRVGMETLCENVLKHGLKDGYFIYAYDDWGNTIGAEECEEGKFFLNTQTWAVLAGVGDERLQRSVMGQVERRLRCDFGYKLCEPAYTKGDDKIGRVSYFVPGMVENAAVYVHGVTFKIAADCKLNEADTAYETLKSVLFHNPAVQKSGVEPYAVTNMYIGPENPYRAGDAPMSWITGSAGWTYRNITESMFGVRAEFDGISVKPCLPTAWKGAYVERIYRGVTYEITYRHTGKYRVSVAGKECKDGVVFHRTDKKSVAVLVEY